MRPPTDWAHGNPRSSAVGASAIPARHCRPDELLERAYLVASSLIGKPDAFLNLLRRLRRLGEADHSSHNDAKLPFDLTIAIPRDRLRPHYRTASREHR